MLKEGNLQSPQKPEVGMGEPPREGPLGGAGCRHGNGLFIIVAFDSKVIVSMHL